MPSDPHAEDVEDLPTEIEISVKPLFSTPLLLLTIDKCLHLNAELSRLILERESSHPTHSDSEVVGWSSPHDLSMVDWAGDPLKELFSQVIEIAKHMTQLSGRVDHSEGQPDWQVAEVWANVQRFGGSNAAHSHPGSFWSGVYYVDTGDIRPGECGGGELRLFDPRGCLPRMLAPYLKYSLRELHDAGTSVSYIPSAGQCLLFPGWLFHAVNVYTGNAPRISIAFNLDPIFHKPS